MNFGMEPCISKQEEMRAQPVPQEGLANVVNIEGGDLGYFRKDSLSDQKIHD